MGNGMGKICNGDNVIPSASTSPNPTFKWLFDITDEELEKERQKFDAASKESFIRRFGEKEGLEKFQKYCDRQSYTCSKEYMQKTRGYIRMNNGSSSMQIEHQQKRTTSNDMVKLMA